MLVDEKQLTQEQEDIVSYDFQLGQVIRIVAFAGTGKTYTLVHLANRLAEDHPEWKILYLAFNKSIQVEAQGKFSQNVEPRTTHSIAFAAYGKDYRHKLGYDIKVRDVCDALKLKKPNYTLLKYAIETLKNYLNSTQTFIQNQHCPGIESPHHHYVNKIDVVDTAKKIWLMMQDKEDKSMPMLHDGYLKLFQLSKTSLPYDVVFFDECQDSNPVTTDIVRGQKHALRVMVGDPHQQIYGFRGAVDAFKNMPASKTFYLTGSFRFGDHFALLANVLLNEYKGERKKLNGLGESGLLGEVDEDLPYAVLTRTNAGIFDEAAQLHQNKKLGFLGGIKNYRFGMVQDVFYLSKGKKTQMNFAYLKKFDDLEDLEDFADETEDMELGGLVKTVKKYGDDIPSLIQSIQKNTISRLAKADVLLATTHKAKGFEFRHVKLKDDFADFFDERNKRRMPDMMPRDEINLYYVAVTRAKKRLQINRKLKRIISYLDKKYNLNYQALFN
ncbi:MAG: ATP-dependent helicase [Planctomycetes bacterium]|nr:ATP-dependent helicase [Planctomycetota bacterium]